jgi:hypothetical protein
MSRETVEFEDVVVKAETPDALLCFIGDSMASTEVWIPKSQIDDDSEVYDEGSSGGTLIVSEWIAVEKGLI